MKTKLSILTAICMVAFFACKKSTIQSTTNNNNNTPPPPSANMTASYSGGTYSVTNAAFTASNTLYGSNNNIWGSSINTVSNTTVSIGIIASFTTTGVYPLTILGAGQLNGVGANYETGYPLSNPGVGTLTVTAYNTSTHLMAGTFSFTAGNVSGSFPMFTVSNGSFSNLSF